jgi:ABC-type amino acid transport substrate-binding protein
VREVGDSIDELTQAMLSIQLLDKPDILLTAHSIRAFKLMAGMALSGGFPVWNTRDMIEWGNSLEQPAQYGTLAVVPKLSLMQGMTDAKGQLLYDLVIGLGLNKVLELTTGGYECSQELVCSDALTNFHLLVKVNNRDIEIKQLEIEEELSQQDFNILQDPDGYSEYGQLKAIKDLTNFETQVLIVSSLLDQSLHDFFHFISLARQKQWIIRQKTIVVFLHHPDSVLEWKGLEHLSSVTRYVFLLQQLPTGALSVPGEGIDEALAYDSIQAVRKVIKAGAYNPCSVHETPISGTKLNLSYSSQGRQLVELARKLCLHENGTKSGRIQFSATHYSCNKYGSETPAIRYQLFFKDNKQLFAEWNSQLVPSLYILDTKSASKLNRTGIEASYVKDLKVLIALSTPFAYKDNETGELVGVAIDLLNYIADKGNYSYNKTYPHVSDQPKWDGLIDDVGTGRPRCGSSPCHIAVGAIIVTPDRAQKCNFTRSFFTSGLRIMAAITDQKENPSIWNFFKPFHWTVWCTIAGMIFISAVIIDRLHLANGFTEGLWLSVSVIYAMQENSVILMRNPFGRVYIIVYSFVLLVLVSAYTANMISFLSIRNSQKDITDINGLRQNGIKVAVRRLSPDYRTLQDAGIRIDNLIGVEDGISAIDAIKQSMDPISSSYSNKTRTSVVADVYVADSPHLEILQAQTCHVKMTSSREMYEHQYAFAMRKNIQYSDHINKLITKAIAEGFVQNSYIMHTANKSVICHDQFSTTSDDDLSLGISNLGGVFIIAAAIAALCFVCKLVALFFRTRSQTVNITEDPHKLSLHGTADSQF